MLDNFTPFDQTSLVEILNLRALNTPDEPAYRFIHCDKNRPDEEIVLTYGEMDTKVRLLATILQDRIELGDRVLLLYP
ncbi:MAG: hypothetical protein COA99_17840, partial [Moraxellaceae bacterium]